MPPWGSAVLSLHEEQFVDKNKTALTRAMCTGKVPAIPTHHLARGLWYATVIC